MSAFRVAIAAGLLAAVAGGASAQRDGHEAGRGADVRGLLKTVDAAKGTITIAVPEGRQPGGGEKTFTLAKDAEIAVDTGRRTVFAPGTLADLTPGAPVALTLTADGKGVEAVLAEATFVRGVVKAVDGEKRTLTVATGVGRGDEGNDKTFSVPTTAEIGVDTGRGGSFSIQPAKLTDLATGAVVQLRVAANGKQALVVIAEGPNLTGVVKAVDAGKRTVTLALPPGRGAEAGEEKTVDVDPEAVVLLDDGTGRRLGVREAKLADVPTGSVAQVKLSADQRTVTTLRAEGPSASGQLKAVDAAKGTITLLVRKGRDEPEEKTFPVAAGARVTAEGATAKLADLKTGDDGHFVLVRLSLDQKTVRSVTAVPRGGR